MRNDDVYLQLYLVRHAESLGNVNCEDADKNDPPLSEHGKKQAELLGERFSSMRPDVLYSSPLSRASATATEIAKTTNSEITYWDKLVEANTVIKDGRFFKEDESDESLNKRARLVIDTLKNKHRNKEKVIVVSHGTFMSFLCNAALNISDVDFCSYNACITKINFRENKNPKLAIQNDISHLNKLDGEKLFWM